MSDVRNLQRKTNTMARNLYNQAEKRVKNQENELINSTGKLSANIFKKKQSPQTQTPPQTIIKNNYDTESITNNYNSNNNNKVESINNNNLGLNNLGLNYEVYNKKIESNLRDLQTVAQSKIKVLRRIQNNTNDEYKKLALQQLNNVKKNIKKTINKDKLSKNLESNLYLNYKPYNKQIEIELEPLQTSAKSKVDVLLKVSENRKNIKNINKKIENKSSEISSIKSSPYKKYSMGFVKTNNNREKLKLKNNLKKLENKKKELEKQKKYTENNEKLVKQKIDLLKENIKKLVSKNKLKKQINISKKSLETR